MSTSPTKRARDLYAYLQFRDELFRIGFAQWVGATTPEHFDKVLGGSILQPMTTYVWPDMFTKRGVFTPNDSCYWGGSGMYGTLCEAWHVWRFQYQGSYYQMTAETLDVIRAIPTDIMRLFTDYPHKLLHADLKRALQILRQEFEGLQP